MRGLTLIAIVLFLSQHLAAQQNGSIATAVNTLTAAMETADEKVLNSITSGKLSYGHSDGRIEDKKTFVSNLATGNSDFSKINISGQTITESGNIALVRHRLDASIKDRGKTGEVHLYVLLVWQKQNGKWLLLARQATKALQ